MYPSSRIEDQVSKFCEKHISKDLGRSPIVGKEWLFLLCEMSLSFKDRKYFLDTCKIYPILDTSFIYHNFNFSVFNQHMVSGRWLQYLFSYLFSYLLFIIVLKFLTLPSVSWGSVKSYSDKLKIRKLTRIASTDFDLR